jgi:hypothetical protein
MTDNGEIQRFLSAIERSLTLWDSVHVRVVAIRLRDEWVCLTGLCILHVRGTPQLGKRRSLWQSSRALDVHQRIPLTQFRPFLEEILSGSTELCGQRVRVVGSIRRSPGDQRTQSDELHFEAPTSWHAYVAAQLSVSALPPPMVNGHLLAMHGGPGSREILRLADGGEEAVNDELRSPRNNIDGIEHLVRRSRASPYPWTGDHGAGINVLAPLGVAFNVERTEWRGDALRLSLVAASQTAIRLGTVTISGESASNSPIVETIRFRDRAWVAEDGLSTAEATISVPDAHRLTLLLRVNGYSVHNLQLNRVPDRPDVLQAAHASHHPTSDRAWRQFLLESEGSHANEFAAAVARLFTGLRLPVVHLAAEKNSANADSIVRFGQDHLLLVESTTSSFDGKKLGNLVRRANELRRELRSRGIEVADEFMPFVGRRLALYGLRPYGARALCVVPIMVVSVPAKDVQDAVLKDAHESHVVVLAREDLNALLRVADVDGDHEHYVGELISGRMKWPLV